MNTDKFEYVIAQMSGDRAYLGKIVDSCDPEFFQNKDIKVFMTKILEFFKKRMTVPNKEEVGVMCDDNEIKSVEKVFSVVENMDGGYNPDELMANTERFFRERGVYNGLVKVTENLSSTNPKVKKFSESQILDIFTKACNLSIIDDIGWNYIDRMHDFTVEISKPQITIPTGYKWLDRMLNGGWLAEGKALYLFQAGTNVGKSIMLANLAANAFLAGKNVALATLEMSEIMYTSRIVAKINGLDVNTLKQHTVQIENNTKVLKSQGAGTLIIKEFPTKATTVSRLSAWLEQVERSGIKPDILIVDYLNILHPGREVNNTYEDGKICSEQLRALTYQIKCPCISATQLNRKGMKTENAGLEDGAESIGVAYTADFAATLWSTEEDKQLGIMHMGIQKSRFEKNWGVCNLKIDYPTMTISEIDDDEITTEMLPDTTAKKSVVQELDDWMS